jgi:hypothetical protein
MELLILDTSKYDDPLSQVWQSSLRYTASYLRRRGIDVAISFVPVLSESFDPSNAAPLVLYFEMSDDNVSPSLSFLAAWRRSVPGTLFLVGGIVGSQIADTLLAQHPELDGVIVGECDQTLAELIASVRSCVPIAQIDGLRVRGGDFKARSLLKDLDDLGMMVHDGLQECFDRMLPDDRVAYLLAGRGCYADCSFCSIPAFAKLSSPGPRRRSRSVGIIVDEMQTLMDVFGVHRFVFQDSNFFGSGKAGQKHARDFAAEILRRKLDVKYFVTCRVDDVEAQTIRTMKESGLACLGIGVESLNQRSLSLFGKRYDVYSIYQALDIICDSGLSCEVNLIFFEPTMTLADVGANLDFIEYVAQRELLTYSDAFPFKTLSVAPWLRIATKLAVQGALDSDRKSFIFHDRRVGALADFADRLQKLTPRIFKRRFLLAKCDRPAASGSDMAAALSELGRCTAQVRDWLGLTVIPRYMREAYSAVMRRPDDFASELAEIETAFAGKMTTLRSLGIRFEEVITASGHQAANDRVHADTSKWLAD